MLIWSNSQCTSSVVREGNKMVWVFIGCRHVVVILFIYLFMMTEIALGFCGNLYHLQSRRTVQKLLPSGKLGSTCGLEIMQVCMIRFVDSIGVQRFRFLSPHLQVSYCALYNRYQFIGKFDAGFVWRILYRTWWLIMWEILYVERSYLNWTQLATQLVWTIGKILKVKLMTI